VANRSGDDLRIGALDGAAMIRERRTTQELVFALLREAILSGRLRGGSHLVQDKIAGDLHVSRVPVREALLQLESEGLVRMQAHRGASVVWLSADDVTEVFEIRAMLVSAAIRRVVPHLSEDQLARLRAIGERQLDREHRDCASLTHELFATLFERLDRPRMRALMDKLEREVRRYLTSVPERPCGGHHQELVDAICARDAERASQLVTRNLERLAGLVVEHMALQN
jgi:DNA-binding GntR family transcriptional regulator